LSTARSGYMWSWGRWRVSESALKQPQQMLTKYLKVEQQDNWLLIWQEPISCALQTLCSPAPFQCCARCLLDARN